MGALVGLACLDENELVDLARGRVKGKALTEAEHHLAVCDECSETLAALATVVNPTSPGAPPDSERATALAPGSILNGTYRIVRHIGHGGMGDVYEAQHLHLEGRRAIKVLNGELAEMAQARPRFMREAGIASALRHPNVVQVVDFNVTSEGRPFLVMEFLEGQHFGDLIQAEAPMALARVLELLAPVASALEAMHRRSIIHRDLKPENIMLVRDPETGGRTVKVLDFGLAKRAVPAGADVPQLSRGRVLLGTPLYMAPEQAAGDLDAVGPAADQFALATLAYEMLSKRPPFSAESTTQILHRVISVDPVPLRSLVPRVPAHVERAVSRALSKDPRLRFDRVGDLLVAMSTPPAVAGPPARRHSRWSDPRALGISTLLLLLCVGAGWAARQTWLPRPSLELRPPVAAPSERRAAPPANPVASGQAVPVDPDVQRLAVEANHNGLGASVPPTRGRGSPLEGSRHGGRRHRNSASSPTVRKDRASEAAAPAGRAQESPSAGAHAPAGPDPGDDADAPTNGPEPAIDLIRTLGPLRR